MTDVNKLIEVRTQIKELKEKEEILSTPRVTDLSLLPAMYDIFRQVEIERKKPVNGVYNRRKFIYVIIQFYSPTTFAGGKTLPGINRAISDLFNLRNRTVISEDISLLKLYYTTYKEFREDVEVIYKAIDFWLTNRKES